MDRARWKRREFLRTAGVASVAAFPWTSAFAEPPPRDPHHLAVWRGLCIAPLYMAEELLRGERFTDRSLRVIGEREAR